MFFLLLFFFFLIAVLFKLILQPYGRDARVRINTNTLCHATDGLEGASALLLVGACIAGWWVMTKTDFLHMYGHLRPSSQANTIVAQVFYFFICLFIFFFLSIAY
jgi:hypothetical protein